MKLSLVVLGIGITAVSGSAQVSTVSPTQSYELVEPVAWREVNLDGTTVAAIAPLPPLPARYTVVGTAANGDSAVVRFWLWAEDGDEYKKFNRNNGVMRLFAASRVALAERSVQLYDRESTWVPGVVLVPVKMRVAPFDFSKDFTLGPAISWRIRSSRYHERYVNATFSFGITSVTLDSTSTAGRVSQPIDVAAVTPSLGLVFEFDDFQIGAFAGMDMISSNSRLNWQYQYEPWLSIGLGYSIFSRDQNARGEGQEQPGN